MKLLFLFLVFISTILPSKQLTSKDIEDAQMSFLDNVENKYEYYNILETIEFDEFKLIIVKGIYNNSGCYGIQFISTVPNDYYLVLDTENSSFTLPKDGVSNAAIAIKADISYAVTVYDKKDNKVNMKKIVLTRFDGSSFDKTGALVGNNTGKSFTSLESYKLRIHFLPVLLVTMAVLTSLVVIAILVLFITKKGLFNKDKRKEGVISMRDIYEAETNDIDNDGISFDYDERIEDNDDDEDDEKPVKYDDTPSTVIPVINPNKREDDDDLPHQITDIKAYLQDKGYFVDYNILSEEEKNKIMMELIKLKNDNMISMDAYYKETYELWKK